METLQKLEGRTVSSGQSFIRKKEDDHDDGNEAEEIDKESVVPTDSCEKASKKSGDHSAHLVHRSRQTHKGCLLFRREIIRQQTC